MSRQPPHEPASGTTAPAAPDDPQALAPLHALAERVLGESLPPPARLSGGGSARAFYRFSGRSGSLVGVVSANRAENRAFLAFTRHFAAQGVPVPRILGEAAGGTIYVMEDLGSETLAERLRAWREAPNGEAQAVVALEHALRWLPVIQVRAGAGLDYRLCPEGQELDAGTFRADLALFTRRFLPRFAPGSAPNAAQRADLEALVNRLDAVERRHFCYRDFQPRNIMWRDGPVFIDYQSGRRGALAYDVASLLYSPDSGLDEPARRPLLDAYLDALADEGVHVNPGAFREALHGFVLIRRLQALGAYARLVDEGKTAYAARVPPALETLEALRREDRFAFGLPALEAWLARWIAEARDRLADGGVPFTP